MYVEPTGKPQKGALDLSHREAEVLCLTAKGLTNYQIATELGIRPTTIKSHLRNIYRKLEAETRYEAINIAVDKGFIVISTEKEAAEAKIRERKAPWELNRQEFYMKCLDNDGDIGWAMRFIDNDQYTLTTAKKPARLTDVCYGTDQFHEAIVRTALINNWPLSLEVLVEYPSLYRAYIGE